VVLRRLHTRRVYTGLTAAAYLGLAAGAQATTFGGPVGLAVLLPSVASSFVLGYKRSRGTAYYHRFERLETFMLANIHELISSIWRENSLYDGVRALRRHKKLVYPRGETSIFYRPAALAAAIRRRRHPEQVAALESAPETLYRFNRLLLRIDRIHQGHKQQIARAEAAGTTDPKRLRELDRLYDRATARLAEIRAERAELRARHADPATFTLFMARRAMGLLVDAEITNDFAARILEDARLRDTLDGHGVHHQGKTWHVDAPAIVAALEDPKALRPEARRFAADAFCKHAEETVLENLKHYYRDRCRELCDLLTMRLQEPGTLHPR
jgi:hypothetical protein